MTMTSTFPTIAQYLLGCQTRLVTGARWSHRVIEFGDGPPLILMHGSNGHAEVFAKNMRTLGRDFRVIAVDALFHGFSSKEPWVDGYYQRLEVQAEGLIDLLDALELPNVFLEGESMGAAIALETAMRWPNRVQRLILSTGFGSVDVQGSIWMRRTAEETDLSRLSRSVAVTPTPQTMRQRMEWLVKDPASLTDELVELRLALYRFPQVAEAMRKMAEPGDENPSPKYSESDLSKLTVPTLVMWTDHNPGDGPEIGRRVADLIPGSEFVVIEEAGHWPHWEQPEQHDEIVRRFFGGGTPNDTDPLS